ncbi:SIR2 family protein [Periweissella ghanensis]|nr:SIR2 family protein [Periweissella ghanensis]MCM0601240.1 SIR2 family protein [Periweissella ghanensis]
MAIKKRLNFLIGSGCSMPAIQLMKGKGENPTKEEIDANNKQLEADIKAVSERLIDDSYTSDPAGTDDNKTIKDVLANYTTFLKTIIDLTNVSNSRQVPKRINIFTTNYDLFIEKAMDEILTENMHIVFNDGANGYFKRYLESYNYNKTTAYRGQFQNNISEVPSISLVKPHGSINWQKVDDKKVQIMKSVAAEPFIVKPDGLESQNTFENQHYYAMLRLFQQELEHESSILIVIGFSFGDEHIKKMVTNALANPFLKVYILAFDEAGAIDLRGKVTTSKQLLVIEMKDLFKSEATEAEAEVTDGETKDVEKVPDGDLVALTSILSINNVESDSNDKSER